MAHRLDRARSRSRRAASPRSRAVPARRRRPGRSSARRARGTRRPDGPVSVSARRLRGRLPRAAAASAARLTHKARHCRIRRHLIQYRASDVAHVAERPDARRPRSGHLALDECDGERESLFPVRHQRHQRRQHGDADRERIFRFGDVDEERRQRLSAMFESAGRFGRRHGDPRICRVQRVHKRAERDLIVGTAGAPEAPRSARADPDP